MGRTQKAFTVNLVETLYTDYLTQLEMLTISSYFNLIQSLLQEVFGKPKYV